MTKINSIEAGFAGESYADHFLKQIDFPKHYAIFKGLHIQVGPESYLQIDTLIVTQKYLSILEIKNIKGKVQFQKNPKQLIRDLNGTLTAYKCPEQQILRHTMKMQKLLDSLKITLPIHNRIVFAFPSSHIVEPPEYIHILMACDLPNHLEMLNTLPDAIPTAAFRKLVKYLSTHSTQFYPKPIADQMQFDWMSLKGGVICPMCLKNIHHKGCKECKLTRRQLYHYALEEWFLLCKDTISNRECVQFLGLRNKHQATYIFKQLDLDAISNNRQRRYTYKDSFWTAKK